MHLKYIKLAFRCIILIVLTISVGQSPEGGISSLQLPLPHLWHCSGVLFLSSEPCACFFFLLKQGKPVAPLHTTGSPLLTVLCSDVLFWKKPVLENFIRGKHWKKLQSAEIQGSQSIKKPILKSCIHNFNCINNHSDLHLIEKNFCASWCCYWILLSFNDIHKRLLYISKLPNNT